MDYQMRAVIFDVLAGCNELKAELQTVGIRVSVPFLGFHIQSALWQELLTLGVKAEECLFLTNKEGHAKEAKECGMVVIGCMEGHFEMPKTSVLLASPEEVSVSYLHRAFCHERKLPATIFETPRLVVRELAAENMETLYEILTKKEVNRYLPAKTGTREEELEKLISYVSHVYSFFEYGYWGIFLKETGELIGRAGFKEGSYPPEAGYVIDSPYWGWGIGTEVLMHMIQYAKEELGCEELCANIDKENKASIRVAEKCGFRLSEAEDSLRYRYVM